ncbi:MAG: S8 family serine peptidase [Blastocatellia bacterium]
MKKGLLVSLIAIAVFILTSVVGANVQRIFKKGGSQDHRRAFKTANAHRRPAVIDARSYRSPGRLRKVMIPADDQTAMAEARSSGAIEISDYGSFKLLVMDDAALEEREREPSALSRPGVGASRNPFTVRDDFNVLMLRSGEIDTTDTDAPGSFVGMGRALNNETVQLKSERKSGGSELRIIQFIGPVKRAWLDDLRSSGLEPIAYVPNNGYLVRGSESARAQVMRLAARGENFIQWEGPFTTDYKIHPQLAETMQSQPGAEVTVALQLLRGELSRDDAKAVKKIASQIISNEYAVLDFINMRVKVDASRIAEIAALSNVLNIEPWNPPQLMDERSSQILAGDLTSDSKSVNGPGYMNWLQSQGFTSKFNFAIDVSDSGMDRGSISADKLHPDFLDANRQSRVIYARDYTSELDAGDGDGHGTINLSIAGGANLSAEKGMRDANGFNYGLGIAPFVLLGSSKIFQSNGRFDLTEPYTKLVSNAYHDGARVSSNSWSEISNSYTIDSQEYDLRARDALPTEAGNQEILICFAAGNAGPGGTIGSPGSAKNVISVAASESSRKDGTDGCGIENDQSDSVMDMANFSSGGPLFDGRIKPDITAPGTHIEGAASQHPDFDASGVCGTGLESPYFPQDQTLYTWSSGTSHSTPMVAGGAALIRQFFLNHGQEPSAALIKAFMVNTTTYMTGEGAGGNLPHARQGWGLLNLKRAFNSTPKIFIDQTTTLSESGQEFVITGEVKESSEPFRVTLAWSDAPGFSAFAPWVNDLNLEVTINGQIYRGNNFTGQESKAGGESDAKNNLEAVWLPAGTAGSFLIRVRAANIAGDGVPGNNDSTDQDFALVVYNGESKPLPVAKLEGITFSGGTDELADPGETVSLNVKLSDTSAVALVGGHGTLSTTTAGVSVTTAAADFPTIAQGETRENLTPFAFAVDKTVACGSVVQFTLDVTGGGFVSRIRFSLSLGSKQAVEFFTESVESGEAKWTHASAIKKKKKKEPIDTWAISKKKVRSGVSSWFSADPGKQADAHLDSIPISLPAGDRNLQLVFYHTFEFEHGEFDGGVIEISTGGNFEDLGSKIVQGGYTGSIWEFSETNPLAGEAAWTNGRLGQFQQVVVDLSSYAGKTVIIRFRMVSDQDIKGLGWYIDDILVRGDRVSCTPVAVANE